MLKLEKHHIPIATVLVGLIIGISVMVLGIVYDSFLTTMAGLVIIAIGLVIGLPDDFVP